MQKNNEQISGVLHQNQGATPYRLRRYFPDTALDGAIEQFWLVDWQLDLSTSHTQRNLPDPNFHLVIENESIRLIGPVSKVYSYKMRGDSRIIGVKFAFGALSELLPQRLSTYVDKELDAREIFGKEIEPDLLPLLQVTDDNIIVTRLQHFLLPFLAKPSKQKIVAQTLVSLIKTNPDIYKMEQLSSETMISLRSIQRAFATHVGVSPKWLIRKYRLSQVLSALENKSFDVMDVVSLLGYADQSHLIRDFNDMLDMTPQRYIKAIQG